MPAAQHALLRVLGHVGAFAGELLRTADVHQRLAGLHVREHLVAEAANAAIVARRCGIDARRELRYLARHRASFLLPLEAPAIHHLGGGVAEQLEHPERVACPPVALVTVEHHRLNIK